MSSARGWCTDGSFPTPWRLGAPWQNLTREPGKLTLWSSTQIPHILKTQIGLQLGIPEHLVRVIAPEVGGGFGCKLNVYREEALVGFASRALGKPVKWIESRSENFLATIHGRGQVGEVELGLMNDGTMTAIRYNVIQDIGAYHQLLTPAIVGLTGGMMPGPYKISSMDVQVRATFTNKIATDAYRGAGRPEATFLRRANRGYRRPRTGNGPRRNSAGRTSRIRMNSLSHQPAQWSTTAENTPSRWTMRSRRSAMRSFGKEQEEARKQGRYIGIGLSTYVEICGMGPSSALAAGGWEWRDGPHTTDG